MSLRPSSRKGQFNSRICCFHARSDRVRNRPDKLPGSEIPEIYADTSENREWRYLRNKHSHLISNATTPLFFTGTFFWECERKEFEHWKINRSNLIEKIFYFGFDKSVLEKKRIQFCHNLAYFINYIEFTIL